MIVKQQVLRYRTAGGKAGIENGQQIFGDQFGESLRSFVRACRISFAPCQRQRYFFQSELLVALWSLSLLDFEKKKKKKNESRAHVVRLNVAAQSIESQTLRFAFAHVTLQQRRNKSSCNARDRRTGRRHTWRDQRAAAIRRSTDRAGRTTPPCAAQRDASRAPTRAVCMCAHISRLVRLFTR
jgi:hypothetical protein